MILYVLRYWPTLTETFVHDEIRGLRAAGVDVELAAMDPRGDPHTEAPPAPVRVRPHRWGWLRALPSLVVEWLRGPTLDRRVLWLATEVRRAKRVHVHFAGEAAAQVRAACLRAGVPYSLTVHAVDLFKPRPDLGDVLRDAAAVVTISEHNRRWLRETYGVESSIVRYGVDLARFARGEPADPPVVLSVGRWVPKKGLDTLAEAARRLGRRAVVRLVSDAPKLDGVEVAGLLPREGVREALAAATVFALPCRRAPDGDLDGIPVAMIEAMAAGLPVITTPVSGIPELVDDEVGWLVPPDDPDALAAAMRAALDDPAEARRRGEAGRARVRARGYTAETALASMRALLGV
ncbi:MAG: glycosyltransferase [Myxococcota bacterium]